MTGAVALLNGCLASGACVDITVRDGVIHEIGDTEATGGTPESDGEISPSTRLSTSALPPAADVKGCTNLSPGLTRSRPSGDEVYRQKVCQ